MTARTVLITGGSSGIGAVPLHQPAGVDINTLVVRSIGQSI